MIDTVLLWLKVKNLLAYDYLIIYMPLFRGSQLYEESLLIEINCSIGSFCNQDPNP